MAIVIVGASDLGTHLATVLSEEQESVILIDPDQRKLESFGRVADVATLCSEETNWQLLDEVLEQHPKLFLALSNSDASNLTACSLAKNLGYPRTVARISDPLLLNQKRLDIDRLFYIDHMIAPELIVAQDLFKCLMNPGSLAIESFAHGAVQMRTIVIPKEWKDQGKILRDLNLGDDLLVGIIRRKNGDAQKSEAEIVIPHGDDAIKAGDEVTFVGETTTMLKLHERFGLPSKKVETAVIAGANTSTAQLALLLLEQGVDVKLIDTNENACKAIAKKEGRITVINQDPSDLNFLLNERVDHADVFLSATHSTDYNILTASIAQEAGARKVYTLVSDLRHAHLLKLLGIEYTISEKEIVASRILNFVHTEAAVSTRTLYENRVVIMELKVTAYTQIAGIPISDLSHLLPKGCLIALIENRGQIMIAKGERILAPGDTVIVITLPELVGVIKEIF